MKMDLIAEKTHNYNLKHYTMKTLKTSFSKNGLDYTLMKRTDKIALFQLGPSIAPDGYEVCRMYIMRPHKAFGVDFEESEIISSNDQFMTDGSGSFRNLDNAFRHFDKMSLKFVRDNNVEAESHSGTELIVECQPVVDNAI
jgi:hypothetical protein